MDRFTKQPYEEFTVSASFTDNLLDGETITSQTVTASDVLGADVSTTVLLGASVASDGLKVSVLVRAGSEASSPYKITFRCATSLSHRWEHDVEMYVEEK
jgi:hypothetical protein